jgi:hypothetical protein
VEGAATERMPDDGEQTRRPTAPRHGKGAALQPVPQEDGDSPTEATRGENGAQGKRSPALSRFGTSPRLRKKGPYAHSPVPSRPGLTRALHTGTATYTSLDDVNAAAAASGASADGGGATLATGRAGSTLSSNSHGLGNGTGVAAAVADVRRAPSSAAASAGSNTLGTGHSTHVNGTRGAAAAAAAAAAPTATVGNARGRNPSRVSAVSATGPTDASAIFITPDVADPVYKVTPQDDAASLAKKVRCTAQSSVFVGDQGCVGSS